MPKGLYFFSCLPSFPLGKPSSRAGHLPIPLLFLYGVPVECEAPEPREDGQLIHLSEALDAVAMEVEDTQVEESGQDLLGKKPKARLDRSLELCSGLT